MSAKEYHARKALSSSGIKRIKESPAHFNWWDENGVFDPFTAPFRVGGALHSLCLDLVPNVLVFSETKTLTSKKGEAFLLDNPDAWVLTKDEHETVLGMNAAIMSNHSLARKLVKSEKECEIYWQEDGVPCKAMIDALHKNCIIDLKTTAEPATRFHWNAKKYGYDIQAAWYRRAVYQERGVMLPFYFAVVEKEPPHGLMIYEIDEETLARADLEIARAMMLYKECSETKHWPSYSPEIKTIGWKS